MTYTKNSMISVIQIIMLVMVLSQSIGAFAADQATPPVVTIQQHPRLWITPERLSIMRQMAQNNSPEWSYVKNTISRAPAIGDSFWDCYTYLVPLALAYQVYKDIDPAQAKVYADHAWNIMKYAIEKPDPDLTQYTESAGSAVDQVLDNSGNSAGYAARGTMVTIPIAYDWLYDYLTVEQRQAIAHKLSIWSDWLYKFAYGRSGIGNFPVSYWAGEALTAIVTWGEDPDAQRHMASSWATYQNIWRKAMVSGSLKGGAFPEGAGYGCGTTQVIMELFSAWKHATDYNPFEDIAYPRDHILYILHYTLPDLARVYMDGDSESRGFVEPVYQWNTMLIGASLFGNEDLGKYAKWWLNHVHTTTRYKPDWRRMVWADPSIQEKPLDDLAKFFVAPASGYVFARTSWQPDATFFSFHCGPKLPGDHVHPDQGHFTIYKNGWLIPETASYTQGAGTDKHNTFLIGPVLYYPPSDYRSGQWGNQDAVLLTSEDAQEYLYVSGNVTEPYNYIKAATKERLEVFTRKIVFLKPDYLVVFDHLITANSSYGKTNNLCFGKEPLVEGDGVVSEPINGTGRVFVKALLPQGKQMQKLSITPPDRPDDYTMNSHWTVQISPAAAAKEDIFLTVFEATDVSKTSMVPVERIDALSGNMVGARLDAGSGDARVAMFAKAEVQEEQVTYAVSVGTGVIKHLILDLKPQYNYQVYQDSRLIISQLVKDSGTLYFISQGGGVFQVTQGAYNPPPEILHFSASTNLGKAPLRVEFQANAQDENGIKSYFWDFGDGVSLTEQNPAHTFYQEGTYRVKLSVSDNLDALAVREITITATTADPNAQPIVQVTASRVEGNAPLTVNFSVAVEDPDGDPIEVYAWDFGDGVTSSEQNPAHTYNTPGVYIAKAEVTDARGAKGSNQVVITANEKKWIEDCSIGTRVAHSNGLSLENWYYYQRGLIRLDLSEYAGKTISSAVLSVHVPSYPGLHSSLVSQGKIELTIYKLTQSYWSDTQANWTTFDGVSPWQSAGGDFVAAPASSAVINTTGAFSNLWASFDVTSLIQDSLASSTTPIANILIRANTRVYPILSFSPAESNDVTIRPKLEVALAAEDPILYGDVSGDGKISMYDAALVAQHAIGLITLTAEQLERADVSGDGKVSMYDAALIAQRALGLIAKFPVE